MNRRPPHGPSTPMPSVTVSLPPYVVARPRKDGTFRVLFEVPKRLRPSGWSPTIPTPPYPHRTGRLDATELAAIKAHVEGPGGLLEQLRRERGDDAGEIAPGSLRAVVADWQASDDWRDLRPRSQSHYEAMLRPIMAWSATRDHPPLEQMTLPHILQFLDLYRDREGMRAALKRTLSVIFSRARAAGVIATHPFGTPVRLPRRRKKRATVSQWRDHVPAYVAAGERIGWPSGGHLLRLMWETSADAADIVTWKRGEHFIDDQVMPRIVYARGKTGELADVPISRALAADLRAAGSIWLVVGRDGLPYVGDDVKQDRRRSNDLKRLRAEAVRAGAPRLVFDHLRHSAATDAIDKGATYEQTRAVTAHADESMLRDIYARRTLAQAVIVQRARGIIE